MDLPETATVHIEISRWSFVKRRPDGTVDFVSLLPSIFSYGSVYGVDADDGDPQDALVVGEAPRRGSTVNYPVWGQVLFMDGGVNDHKWVVGPHPPTASQWARVEHFFRLYAVAKRCLGLWRRTEGVTVFQGLQQRSPIEG